MKLEDWLTEQDVELYSKINGRIIDWPMLSQVHVIGTCGECKWWEEPHMCSEDRYDATVYRADKDFGCIHWEKKE